MTATSDTSLSRRKLPIGIQTFSEIREDNYYYVDKTGMALELINSGKAYFLSRPRRFGKSLFLDTLKELFEGNRNLFTGLAAEDTWDWGKKYPVIRISFGAGQLHSREDLRQSLHKQLSYYENHYTLPSAFPDTRSRFIDLIERLHAQTGQRVTVLVDEYDKPILDNITDSPVAREMREGLKDIYSVLKDSDAHLKFVFLIGVSKFSKVSLFSDLNHLTDITLDPNYSALCGYTEVDVATIFAPELPDLDIEEIRRWYNGYNWLGQSVYNPFDLLLLFRNRKFAPYWFETGTPTFLIKLLAERSTWLPELAQLRTDAELLSTFDVDDIPTEALMFQAGYLTIDRVERKFDEYRYQLRYPNQEVYHSLSSALLRAWTPDVRAMRNQKTRLGDLLLANDFAGLHQLFIAFYASIPYQWYTNNPVAQYEGYYASVFYAYFASLGLDIVCEESSNAGRLDMVVRFNAQVYLFEFKEVELVPESRALQQIKTQGYADKYRAAKQPIHLIGVEFSKQTRSVVGFETETLQD